MSAKSNDKIPILISLITLIIVVLTLIIVVALRPQTQTNMGTTVTSHSSSNIVLEAGHVNSLGILSNVYDVEFNATSGQSVSGAYSSTGPLDFYVMTPSQFQIYMGDVPLDSLISNKNYVWDLYYSGITYLDSLMLPSYGGIVSNYSVSGKFESNYPVTFYILTPSQYSNYEIYHQMGGYVYASSAVQGSTSTISARIPPGSYYFVFYDPTAGYDYTSGTYQNTTVTIQQSIVASPNYNISTVYNATNSQNDTFNTVLPNTGPYYLVWEYDNSSGSVAALQITKTIRLN